LDLQPVESSARELLLRGSILECIRNRYVWEVLEDGALHSQLVEIGIEEGDDALWEAGGEIHDGMLGCRKPQPEWGSEPL